MTSSSIVVPNGIRVVCDFTPGASGGPWFREMVHPNRGYVIGVTSGDAQKYDKGAIHGAPNTADTTALYEHRMSRST